MDKVLGGLLGYQRAWLADKARFKIGLWARQTGKDYTCAAEAVLDCVTYPKRHWLILACGERQARESLEKAREFVRALEESELSGAHQQVRATGFEEAQRQLCATNGGRSIIVKRDSATEIRFMNGSRITALPGKAATVRGYSANLILTEFAFHDDPEGIWKAIFPSVSNPLRGGPKKVRIISTPNGMGNYFHELWTGSKIFSRHRVTIHEAVAQKLPVDVQALRDGLLDSEAWAQEYECEFADQSAVLLPYELIEGCEAPEATETSGVEYLSRSWDANVHGAPELFVGIDFGRKQDLTVCWILEKVRHVNLNSEVSNTFAVPGRAAANFAANFASHGARASFGSAKFTFLTREVLVLRRMATPMQIEALRPRVRLARRVCVDYTGAGVGLGDALAEEFGSANGGGYGKVELCTFTAGLKEEIFVKLRAAMERRSVWIPKSTEIREDLHAVHRVVSNAGQISFRASRTADGHSDRCTALALALRAGESAPVSQGASTVGRKYAMGPTRRRGLYR